jgi:hypothetical protein
MKPQKLLFFLLCTLKPEQVIMAGPCSSKPTQLVIIENNLRVMAISKLSYLHKHRNSQDYNKVDPDLKIKFNTLLDQVYQERQQELAQYKLKDLRYMADRTLRATRRNEQRSRMLRKYNF